MAPVTSALVPWRPSTIRRCNLWAWAERYMVAHFPGIEICTADSGHEPFNRAASRNVAYAKARGDLLLVIDADTICSPDLVEGPTETWRVPGAYLETTLEGAEALLSQDPSGTVVWPPPRHVQVSNDAPLTGCWLVAREAYEAVGGFDERFHGWGYEDVAFARALETLVGPPERAEGTSLVHLHHPVDVLEQWEQPEIGMNRALFDAYIGAYGDPVAMREVVPCRS